MFPIRFSPPQMKLQIAALLIGVVSMSVFPAGARAASNVTAATDLVQSSNLEPPHALPLAVASAVPAAPAAAAQLNNDLGEIWQEDDREVLIRNARRAKDNNGGAAAGGGGAGAGSSAGKKGKGVKKAQRQSGAKATVTPAAASAAGPSRGDGAVQKSGAESTKIPPSK